MIHQVALKDKAYQFRYPVTVRVRDNGSKRKISRYTDIQFKKNHCAIA